MASLQIPPPNIPFLSRDGTVSDVWYRFLLAVVSRAGGILGGLQPEDDTLTALAALSGSTGLVAQTGADTFTKRSLTAPAAGITVANASGAAGNPTLALANDLAAVEGLAGAGMAARTGVDTWALRTVTGTAGEIAVANGSGTGGNPTLSLAPIAGVAGTYAPPASITVDGSGRITAIS